MERIFNSHFTAIRQRLTAEGEIARAFHNKTNKGNIRETFVREMLDSSTPGFCSVGSGEIIHRDMEPDAKRNQIDVILYNGRFPKLPGADGVDLHFVETVSSFIEVKSKLTKGDIRQAAQVSKRIKSYPNVPPQHFSPAGMVKTPRPYSFLFAYDATATNMKTIQKWMKEIASEDDYNIVGLTQAEAKHMPFFPHLFLDGVFVLNKGYVHLDAMPWVSAREQNPDIPTDHIWVYRENHELEVLWAAINMISEKLLWNRFEVGEYLGNFNRFISD